MSEWDRCWGRVQDITGQAVVVGEWGGKVRRGGEKGFLLCGTACSCMTDLPLRIYSRSTIRTQTGTTRSGRTISLSTSSTAASPTSSSGACVRARQRGPCLLLYISLSPFCVPVGLNQCMDQLDSSLIDPPPYLATNRDLNPESGDTGGVLKGDWWTPEETKLKIYDAVQPHPSWLSKVRQGRGGGDWLVGWLMC